MKAFGEMGKCTRLALIATLLLALYAGGAAAAPVYDALAGYSLAGCETALNASGKSPRYDEVIIGAALDETLPAIDLSVGHPLGADGMTAEPLYDVYGIDGTSLMTDETGVVWWGFTVEQAGWYRLFIEYYTVKGHGGAIERAVFVDGVIPYREAAAAAFDRVWEPIAEEFRTDNQSNQVRLTLAEQPSLVFSDTLDTQGYSQDTLLFYLDKGDHTLALMSLREPMLIKSISFLPPYKEKAASDTFPGVASGFADTVVIQAEYIARASSPNLSSIPDHSSPHVTPASPRYILQNAAGGSAWNIPGQWIEWTFDAPEDGWYTIGANIKQTWVRGAYVARRMTIDGEAPYQSANQLEFSYGGGWRRETLGSAKDAVYLTRGRHTLRLTAILGSLAGPVREVEQCVARLNEEYRRIVMLTGYDIDRWRDYQIALNLQGIEDRLSAEYDRLDGVVSTLHSISSSRSDQDAVLETLMNQLAIFIDDPEKIPARLAAFKTSIGALGGWLIQRRQCPLAIDEFYITPYGKDMPEADTSFIERVSFGARKLINSFFVDYDTIGSTAGKDARGITLWAMTGRDQANTLKTLIEESFTPDTGIDVNLMIMGADTLLPAVLSGQGPDAAMMVSNDLPVNYAMRGAAADLARFDDFGEVAERFRESAMTPYTYDGSCYALPDTQTINMMYYRKDIMEELGFELPETWDDVRALISLLSRNNMEFGMAPIPASITGGSVNFGSSNTAPTQSDLMFGMFLYQRGGEFYRNNGSESALDSDEAAIAFREWTQFYTEYSLTREFDFQSRFRIGETPIGIADMSLYNMLQVAAPEIKGLWGFTAVPGMRQEDGSIDRTAPSSGTASMILSTARDKEACWSFLKWWTSADIQAAYGRGMEALQGAAARYPTANVEALSMISWPGADIRNLTAQYENVRGIPQVPGGYYTARNIVNAFVTVVIDKKIGPREALMDVVQLINDELANKRREFGVE